ncbi:hypothetical protein QR680_005468 [Steinernema hermaphroditum]|uniref:Dynein light chain n=1 Tax=Steinernema hermaphroditum TaxID=289476 RepID=A0AA39HS54_9BILA|nr:hypothetical protein QR680_005468 [Steinernema hermaphroditum]
MYRVIWTIATTAFGCLAAEIILLLGFLIVVASALLLCGVEFFRRVLLLVRLRIAMRTKLITAIKKSTMSEGMEKYAVVTAIKALRQFTVEKNAARYIKEEFDRKFQGQWHCVVGKQFGCFVSHFESDFAYFYLNSVAVMLFRTAGEDTLPEAE